MRDKQVRAQRYFKDIEVNDKCAGFYLKKLLCSLNPVESDSSFITVANTGIPIIVGQIFYNKFLANVDNLMNIFADHIDKFDGELA